MEILLLSAILFILHLLNIKTSKGADSDDTRIWE